jgi:hypothetical protein
VLPLSPSTTLSGNPLKMLLYLRNMGPAASMSLVKKDQVLYYLLDQLLGEDKGKTTHQEITKKKY